MERKKGRSKKKSKSTYKKKQRKRSTVTVQPNLFKHLLSIIWNIIFYLLLMSILIGAIVFKLDNSPDKSMYGYQFMTVKTNSMAPQKKKPELKDGFYAGDVIIVKRIDPDQLKNNDIITFYPVQENKKAFLTHRIIEINTPIIKDEMEIEGLTTQGDANDHPDVPIQREQVVGKVVKHISGVGGIIDFIRDNITIVVMFILILFLLTFSLNYYLKLPTIKKKKSKKKHRHSK